MAKSFNSRSLPSAHFALPSGPVELKELDTVGRRFGPQTRKKAEAELAKISGKLAGRQDRLFAQASAGAKERVLVVLQGMDTAGKDGVIDHVFGPLKPSAIQMAAFKKPTDEELAHDFLWRIEKQVPAPGVIGVFNRSQYEDVLVVRVHELVPESVWSERFALINEFERKLAEDGVTIVKCFLHVSKKVQKERLAARLEDPEKYWKYNDGDLAERARWADYQTAYADALAKCHTAFAPWYVIPADRKWYRNWAVGALVDEALRQIDPQYPPAAFDIKAERRKVAES